MKMDDKCIKCGGNLVADNDDGAVCLQCGYRNKELAREVALTLVKPPIEDGKLEAPVSLPSDTRCIKNLADLFDWRKLHPNDPLCSCANFNEQVHLVYEVRNSKGRGGLYGRGQVVTLCGLTGSSRQHLLVFAIPIDLVDCLSCLRRKVKQRSEGEQ